MKAPARSGPALLAAAGVLSGGVAAASDAPAALAAAEQTWPAFVLVAGLLLVGIAAAGDGLFSATGHWLAATAHRTWALFGGFSLAIGVVTALLNLDTSVAFLTPVALHTARRRGEDPTYLLAACLLLSNAGSLLLPGSNLTNLIVTGHQHLPGGTFVLRMALPWLVSLVVTSAITALVCRRDLGSTIVLSGPRDRPRVGLGLAAVIAAVVLVVVLRSPSLPVLAVGAVVVAARVVSGRVSPSETVEVLGLPVLVGLFGLAVAMGTIGRAWGGPQQALGHLGPLATAGTAAVATVVLNNLPAAALLSARAAPHPLSLLIGLDVGPNLFVTGSLAWVLWLGAARGSGEPAPLRRTVVIGLLSAPLAVAAAEGALCLAGSMR